MFQKRNVLFLLLFVVSCLQGQTRIKTMFYNTLNYNSDIESQNRTPHLKTVLNYVQPDLFMVCELKNETASNYLFNNAVVTSNPNFEKAEFKISQSPATDLLQMVYFNKNKLTLEFNEVIPTGVRDINHYTFRTNTQNQIRIEVFVTHLKASRGIENRNKREESIELFVRQLDRLPQDAYVVFAGDFNFYTSNEEGFKKLIDTSNYIQIIDPINRLCPDFPNDGKDYFDADYDNTYFWNNSTFADVHSQSTRTSTSNGAGGGMDDRFDFIMLSKNFSTSSELYYLNSSYKTIGNNGNCYNSFVSNSDCSGTYPQNLRDALYNFSDHLPVVLEIENVQSVLNTTSFNTSKLKYTLKNNTLNLGNSVNTINIYNTLGQLVYHKNNKNSQQNVVNLSTLKKGLYILKVDSFKPLKFLYH
ncbi:MAG: T9SS type A sorting domain-containing protein [Flavobacteriaceae bacterium]|nr:T9SS type A sorting domain-containing protein [Flavobacteriaceae bacterium]